ncbi:Calponin homology domain [Macleaya cordata]|uniref:Calponin homology domain n=1 Tax=Macleaya cordata TaxID=56857 RepID=A0A200PTI9_MACCD|nr:Calponin homology domain [Macleaya cordata]
MKTFGFDLTPQCLLTQTRIWLGEVLHTRLDEEMVVADLLADGKLLFQVSKVVWKMLLTKCMELRNSKAYICEKAASEKRSRRYMPYSNVDSFLKICKIMGLTSIDLFSPSDVVEKKDSRRVCMCIRSLSKKARSKGLNVPDFDVVTYTIAMPTDMVGGIRRSLEKSQCRILIPAGSGPCMDSKPKYRQKNWGADYVRQHDSYSEESDDAESNYNVFGFDSPASNASCGDASLLVSSIENSLGKNLVVAENCILRQSIFESDEEKDESGPYQPIRSLEMKGSLRAHHLQNNNHLNAGAVSRPSSTPLSCKMGLGFVDDQGTNASFMGETVDEYSSETSYVGCESGISDFIGHGEGNEMVFNFYPGTEFHGSNSIDRSSRHGLLRSFSEEIEDVEVSSSTGSLNSISGKVATIDYEDQFEAEDDYLNIQIPQLQNLETGYMDASSTSDYETSEMVKYDTPMVSLTWDTDKRQCGMKFEDIGSATKPLPAAEWLPDSGKIQNTIVSDIHGVDISHVDSESVKDSTVQLRSKCSDQLDDCGALGNMYWDQPGILPGQSNGNQKCSVAIVLDGNNGLGYSPPRSRCSDYACHSPTEVSGDGSNANPIIPDDVEVLGDVPNDPDMKMRENQKSSSLTTDSSSNSTEIATGALNVVPRSLGIEENEKCDTRYEETIDCRSGSKERSVLNNSTNLTVIDGNEVCSIASQSVEPSSLPMKYPSGITFREASQDHHVCNDRSVPLIDDIVQSSKLGSLASHLVDKSEKFKMEIRGMGSPVDFPICQKGSGHDDTHTLKMVSVDDPVARHNDDDPLCSCAPKPENEPCETPASSKSVGKNYSDQHLVDVNNLQVGHGASTNHDKDVAYCTENVDKDEEKLEKVERHTGTSKSNPRKTMLLKSVAGGVTLLGVFLLFQLSRKSGREKIDEKSVPSIQINKTSSGEAPRRNKQQGGRTDRVYPGDKSTFIYVSSELWELPDAR